MRKIQIPVIANEFALDFVGIGRQQRHFHATLWIHEEIECLSGAKELVVHIHRRDDLIDPAVRVIEDEGCDEADIDPIVLGAGDCRNQEVAPV